AVQLGVGPGAKTPGPIPVVYFPRAGARDSGRAVTALSVAHAEYFRQTHDNPRTSGFVLKGGRRGGSAESPDPASRHVRRVRRPVITIVPSALVHGNPC